MFGRAVYLRVGLMILLGIAVAVALAWFLGGGQINNGTLFETYFPEAVQGLQNGSSVAYRGVTVGRVNGIGVAAAEYGGGTKSIDDPLYRMVFVRFVVDTSKIGPVSSIEDAVKLGLRARLGTQLITGVSYIDLDFFSARTNVPEKLPWTPKGIYVPSAPSTFASIQNAGQQLLAKLDTVDVGKLVTTLTELSESLVRELDSGDIHRALSATETLMTTADKAVVAADLPKLVADLRQTSDSLRGLTQSPDLKRLLANGALATDRLAELTGKMSPLIAALDGTVRQVSSGATQLQAGLAPLVRNMQAASENLRELTASLRQYPAQVLSGPPPPVSGPLR